MEEVNLMKRLNKIPKEVFVAAFVAFFLRHPQYSDMVLDQLDDHHRMYKKLRKGF